MDGQLRGPGFWKTSWETDRLVGEERAEGGDTLFSAGDYQYSLLANPASVSSPARPAFGGLKQKDAPSLSD